MGKMEGKNRRSVMEPMIKKFGFPLSIGINPKGEKSIRYVYGIGRASLL